MRELESGVEGRVERHAELDGRIEGARLVGSKGCIVGRLRARLGSAATGGAFVATTVSVAWRRGRKARVHAWFGLPSTCGAFVAAAVSWW